MKFRTLPQATFPGFSLLAFQLLLTLLLLPSKAVPQVFQRTRR